MKDPFEDEPLLEGFQEIPLEAFTTPPAPGELHDRSLRETSAIVRRRRYVLFATRCGAAAALFACGVGAGVLMTKAPAATQPANVIQLTNAANPAPTELVPDAILADGEEFALKLHAASKPEQLALLRRAGDRYLNEFGEVQLALRCYQRLLEIEGPDEKQTVDMNDTWLLMALKSDRQLESKHDQPST